MGTVSENKAIAPPRTIPSYFVSNALELTPS